MDCPTVSFAYAEVVFGVSLSVDAMVAERRPPRSCWVPRGARQR